MKTLAKSLALTMLASWAWAAEAGSLTAEMSSTEIGIDETAVLTIAASGVRDEELTAPQVPGLVIRQQGVSESTVFTNGHRTSELTITYGIYPQQAGEFKIPSVSLVLDGKAEATLPLTLKVRGAGQAPPQAQTRSQPGGAAGGKAAKSGKSDDTGGVFVERECSNNAPFVGEPIICTIRVYHRGNLNGGNRVAATNPDVRQFGLEGEQRYQRLVNGQRFAVIELKEVVIPRKAGAVEIAPFALNARVLVYNRKNNPMDKFFDKLGGGVFNFDLSFTEEKEVLVKSEPTVLAVKALPEEGKPAGYSGLVGNFQLTTSVSKNQVAAGDTLTITIKVEGEGVSDMMADPSPKLEALGRIYPDKPEYKESATADQGVRSSRVYKFALVPAKPGTHSLGGVDVPAFNPKLGQYVTLHADLGQLIVDPGKAEEKPLVVGNNAPAGTGKEEVKALGKDFIGPHSADLMSSIQTITKTDQIILYSLGGFPTLFAFSAFSLSSLRSRSKKNVVQVRRSKAHRAFREGTSLARTKISEGKVEQGLAEAHRAFRVYLGDKLNLQGSALAAKEVDAQLARLGVHESSRAVASEIFRRIEQLEFGGRLPTQEVAKELVEQLDGLVTGVEKT